jgi:NADH:ubiquinone oxidoreductase subunit 3 (subunit A)
MRIGWVGLFECSVVFALLFIPFLYRIKRHAQHSVRVFKEGG